MNPESINSERTWEGTEGGGGGESYNGPDARWTETSAAKQVDPSNGWAELESFIRRDDSAFMSTSFCAQAADLVTVTPLPSTRN